MSQKFSAESDFRNEAPEGFFLTNVPYEGFSKKSFNTEYEMLEQLGKGAFSEVRQCRHKPTGKLYAVKISKRDGGQFSFDFLNKENSKSNNFWQIWEISRIFTQF